MKNFNSTRAFLAHLSLWLIDELIGWSVLSVCVLTFSNVFSSGTAGPIEVKFHVEYRWDGGTKVCEWGPGHMTRCSEKLSMLKNLLLRNRWADFHETRYVAWGT